MADFKILNKARIQSSQIFEDARTYISRAYKRTGEFFTAASPYAQILLVLSELGQLIMFYIEDALVEQNIYTAQQTESIYGLARLAGHDPTRGFSATGQVKFRWKPGVTSDIAGDALTIPANAEISFPANGLVYLVRTNGDQFRLDKNFSGYINAPIIQGKLESQTLTATGERLQSFNVKVSGATGHDTVRITVNSELWTAYNSLYEMNSNSKGYLIKTGIMGGLDLYFGNGNFGMIPPAGAIIGVEYIKHDGTLGNLGDAKDITFKWITEGTDSVGTPYDLNQILDFEVVSAPKMGGDPESTEFTKLIAPLASKSFVLATPENYEHFLSRYNSFSYIDAYNTTDDGYLDDDNVMYLFMLPDAKRKLTGSQDYFALPVEEFTFTATEQAAIQKTIEDSGQQMVVTDIEFVTPTIKKYRMDIYVRYFEGFDKNQIFKEVRSKMSEYLLNITRRDKLPKSDIIALLEAVEGIDAVNVQFVSALEEEARRLGYYYVKTIKVTPSTPVLQDIGNGKQRFFFFEKSETLEKVNLIPGQPNPVGFDKYTGLDKYGDIILQKEDLALFRGGWYDRDNTIVKDSPALNEMASLSVYFDEPPVQRTVFTQLQAATRKML
jgi:hypothetical protein